MRLDAGDIDASDPAVLEQIRSAAQHYLSGRGGLAVPRGQRDWPAASNKVPEFQRSGWAKMAELGWAGILVPQEHGGMALGLAAAEEVATMIGRWVAPEPFTSVAGVSVTLLAASKTAMAADMLEEISQGRRIVGYAIAEHLTDADQPQCRLAAAGGEAYLLTGRKEFCTPVDPVDGWLLTARDDTDELTVVHVSPHEAGLRLERGASADGRALGTLHFSGVKVAAACVLVRGAPALQAIRKAVAVGQVLTAAELLGSAQRLQELTLAHIKTRQQFGKPLGAFQVLQHRCVEVLVQLELAAACLKRAVAGDKDATFETSAIRARLRAAKCAFAAAQTAVQLHGAMGYTDECDVGLFYRRIVSIMGRMGSQRDLRSRWAALQQRSDMPADSQPWDGGFPRTADWEAMDDAAFRAMVRAFLAANYPERIRHLPWRPGWVDVRDWFLCLSAQGWVAPLWPESRGGMGLPPEKFLAWMEELEAYGAAPLPNQGIGMLGPVLMRHGTPEQQANYLPAILSAEHVWAQGYSEPNAGSDLASLRMQAVVQGDNFIVNGQKIWTTLAHEATHIFMLVRTNNAVKPQAGISFLLCELKTPGITVRPIRNIAGQQEFCEVFFDSVQVPLVNLVGGMDQGWHVAKALLGHERLGQGSPKFPQAALAHLGLMAGHLGLRGQADYEAIHADLALDVADLTDLYAHYAQYVKRGEALPPSVSVLKIWGTETYQRIAAEIARQAGEHAGREGGVDVGGAHLHLLAPLWNAAPASIYGGSNEIHRNILAKTVLELPS